MVLISLSYTEQNVNKATRKESKMVIIDGSLLSGLAALITAFSALIWSVRRRG